MKLSKYNYEICGTENEVVLYNTLHGGIIALTEAEYLFYTRCRPDNSALAAALIEEHFWVEDELDETALTRLISSKAAFQSDTLTLTIAPTLDCNCRCNYCYESLRQGQMSAEVQQGIILYLQQALAARKYKKIRVVWYGGEPLLAFPVIAQLSREIMAIAEAHGLEYGAHMTTNGLLLTAELIDQFARLAINSIQIPIDGSVEEYNIVKQSSGLALPYQAILDRLKLFEAKDVSLCLRINITQHCDINSVERIITDILALENPKISYYLAKIMDKRNCKTDISVASDGYFDAINAAIIEKYGYSQEISVALPFCTAEVDGNMVVDELGYMYKCWEDIGQEQLSIGNVQAEQINFAVLCRYMSRDTLGDSRCRDCVMYPLCAGGCAKFEIDNGCKCCFSEKNILDTVILAQYNSNKSNAI